MVNLFLFITTFSETCEWLQPAVKGDLPVGRGQHSVAVAGDKLVLFGGSSDFRPELMVCQKFHGDLFTLDIGRLMLQLENKHMHLAFLVFINRFATNMQK